MTVAKAAHRIRAAQTKRVLIRERVPHSFELERGLRPALCPQERHHLAYLFISHDLKVVRALADEVIVLRHGLVVERGPASQIFSAPREAYTQTLMTAAFRHSIAGTAADGPSH